MRHVRLRISCSCYNFLTIILLDKMWATGPIH